VNPAPGLERKGGRLIFAKASNTEISRLDAVDSLLDTIGIPMRWSDVLARETKLDRLCGV
jgi:hypothetical protein